MMTKKELEAARLDRVYQISATQGLASALRTFSGSILIDAVDTSEELQGIKSNICKRRRFISDWTNIFDPRASAATEKFIRWWKSKYD